MNKLYLLLIAYVAFVSNNAFGQSDWSRFRGPNGTGLVLDAALPTQWQQTLWDVKLAGVGSSSPVAWGDQLFVTSCDMQTAAVTLECLNAEDGTRLWSQTFESFPYHLHDRNFYAASTPTVGANQVYVAWANPDHTMLVALDHEGKEVWRRDFGRWISSHGFGMSPILCDEKVILCNSQTAERLPPGVEPGQSRMIAVNRDTGDDVWSTRLTTRRVCYGVPCLFDDAGGKRQIVGCNTGDGFYSVDPDNGVMNWTFKPFKQRVVASMLVAGRMLIGGCGSGGGGNYVVAIKPDEMDDAGRPKEAYLIRQANYVPSPIAVGDNLFLFTDKGVVKCVDLETGKLNWQERVSSGFSGSPVATAQYVYCLDEDGNVFVIAASDKYELISKTELGEPSRATPMIFGNRIYFRTDSQLFCVGKSE